MHKFGGGRSDLFNSGGKWSKWGELTNPGGFGPRMKLCGTHLVPEHISTTKLQSLDSVLFSIFEKI